MFALFSALLRCFAKCSSLDKAVMTLDCSQRLTKDGVLDENPFCSVTLLIADRL